MEKIVARKGFVEIRGVRSVENEECRKWGVCKMRNVESAEFGKCECGKYVVYRMEGWFQCFPVLIRGVPIAASVTSHSNEWALRIAYWGTKKAARKLFSQWVSPWTDVKLKASETIQTTYILLNDNWQRDQPHFINSKLCMLSYLYGIIRI